MTIDSVTSIFVIKESCGQQIFKLLKLFYSPRLPEAVSCGAQERSMCCHVSFAHEKVTNPIEAQNKAKYRANPWCLHSLRLSVCTGRSGLLWRLATVIRGVTPAAHIGACHQDRN